MTIGPVTATRVVDDAKATAIANLFYDAEVVPNWPAGTPLPSTAQERLQAVVDRLAINMRDVARGQQRHVMRAEHEAAVVAAMSGIDV
jgi:hypothetical protein